MLLPPKAVSDSVGGNPYLAMSGLDSALGLIILNMNASTTVRTLESRGATGQYSVVQDLASAGPVLYVSVSDTTAAGALQT